MKKIIKNCQYCHETIKFNDGGKHAKNCQVYNNLLNKLKEPENINIILSLYKEGYSICEIISKILNIEYNKSSGNLYKYTITILKDNNMYEGVGQSNITRKMIFDSTVKKFVKKFGTY